jgi:hypothetical protein
MTRAFSKRSGEIRKEKKNIFSFHHTSNSQKPTSLNISTSQFTRSSEMDTDEFTLFCDK